MKYVLLVAAFSLIACTRQEYVVIHQEEGRNIIDDNIDGILDVPQDLELFKSQIRTRSIQCRQLELNSAFDKMYLAPWNDGFKCASCFPTGPRLHCENLHKLTRLDSQLISFNIKNAVQIKQKGIIVRHSMARAWPTNSQLFLNIRRPGDSYPFDSNIQSIMRLGTPVLISAISQDGMWGFVSSYAFSGWVSMHDIAYVSEKFIKLYKSCKMAVAVRDGIAVKYKNSFVTRADIGTILPKRKFCVLCPHKKPDGYATLVSCAVDGFASKPLPFTADNVMSITKQFLGQRYGWGGYLNLRDCSMLTMDFCTTFGILIARNGNTQLTQGKYIHLKGDKAEIIRKTALPFWSLVGKKGHVMLYVGTYKDKPVFLHNIWGVPVSSGDYCRYVIGKTVLTSIDFGKDIPPCKTLSLQEIVTHMRYL